MKQKKWHSARPGGMPLFLFSAPILPAFLFLVPAARAQLVLMLIPDVRQALGAAVSTWDFVLSQGSGNAGLLCWMLANALWARRQEKREVTHHEC